MTDNCILYARNCDHFDEPPYSNLVFELAIKEFLLRYPGFWLITYIFHFATYWPHTGHLAKKGLLEQHEKWPIRICRVFTCRLVGTNIPKSWYHNKNHGIQNAQQWPKRLMIFSQFLPSLCATCIRRFANRLWAICGCADGPSAAGAMLLRTWYKA